MIEGREAPLDNCVGFIDFTKVQICRPEGPSNNQRSAYLGHERFHCLVYQTITTPDGLVFNLFGPVEGCPHEMTLYTMRNMEDLLSSSLHIGGKQYCIYRDAAYASRPWMQIGFPNVTATEYQQVYNALMSSVREAVE